MEYRAKDIAAYIVNYSIDNGNCVSNLKLQKLLYYVQAYFAVKRKKRCFIEDFEHWRHGPVIPEIYSEYKAYFNEDITDYQDYERINSKDKNLIDKVIEAYSSYSAWGMVRKTHKEDPWINSDDSDIIEWDEIYNYYKDNESEVLGV